MKHSAYNYLRTYRKRYALSTKELALLLGHRTGTSISSMERGARMPSLRAALGLQAIFGIAPRELFPGLFEHVEDDAMRRAGVFHKKLEGRKDPRSRAKLELLEEMPSRPGAHDIAL